MTDKDIGPLIKRVNDKLKAAADASLKESGLTFSQTIVMEFVHSQGGQTTQKEIEDHMQVSHPTVVGIVTRLEKNGFLTCCMDETDRRIKIVRETDKAVEAKNTMCAEAQKTERRITAGLSDKDLEDLRRMLNTIYNNI
ncbi:MarR family winged helix-turn-helix transcriptional regulator [Huintestinicola sp.]|uniref:MarR family winged helix-turn-helix transcriptional regulator n=1 Tax=Huintestinicola sp. TaxID=2981661 RepID=UPI003D7DEEBF